MAGAADLSLALPLAYGGRFRISPPNVPVNPDVNILRSGLPARRREWAVLQLWSPSLRFSGSDPWQVIRSGSTSVGSARRFDLARRSAGFAICHLLCFSHRFASSPCAAWLVRYKTLRYSALRVLMLVKTDQEMAGYVAIQRVQMQKRMLDAAAAIPGVSAVAYADRIPLGIGGGDSNANVHFDTTQRFPSHKRCRRC